MKPLDLGTLFEVLAEKRPPTAVRLSRPLDIAPALGTEFGTGQLAELVAEASGWLAAAGARAGDRIAVVKRNHWDYVLLTCAAARIGAVPALISDRLGPDSLRQLLGRLEPALLVADERVLGTARAAGVDLTGAAARTLCLDGANPVGPTLDDVRGHRVPPVRPRHDDEPLLVIHTSGTTGVPKLVVHSTTTLIRRLAGFEAHRWPVLAGRRRDTVGSAIAFSHGRAVAWTASAFWLAPRKVVIVADAAPEAAAPVLRAHPPTMLEALPSTYARWHPLCAGADNPFRDVRLFISTFDAVHPPTIRTFLGATRRRTPIWMQGWGQTETGPLTFRFLTRRAVAGPADRHPTTRDLGRPLPGWVGLRVVHPETMRPLPRGQSGLVLARTKARCLGYVGEQDRWHAKVQDGWFNTGDIGVRSRGGSLLLLDREVDMIPGISCVELEDLLHDRLPEVEEAVVLATADGHPLPVLVTRTGGLDPQRWRHAVHDLPPLAEPVTVAWDALPRTGTGKVRRHELRERFLQGAAAFGTGQWT
ncbi:class I adenylate-forming enzyme family protein [Streptacidiphilus sp. P02-A3a]|uniref:class I adenylate-forming enzyme family protein n=1 Tax=Streptacidiphilus sp. P02-A3a TaxID=2704468 RepID=UPI0015FDE5B0|nr:class I adenylate-forming enzyme family protein [Streptacidiphilus sp. P02-A3a]QMU71337.1 acyl--CoA ligase [Streptacidiphilus sp. P02-A3a]